MKRLNSFCRGALQCAPTNGSSDLNPIDIFVNGKKVNCDRVCDIFTPEHQAFPFESIRNYYGRVFRLEQHLARLSESAKTIGLVLHKPLHQFKREVLKCAKIYTSERTFLRLSVDGRSSYIIVTKRERSQAIYEAGVRLTTAVTRRNFSGALPPEAKTSAFFNHVAAWLDRQENVFDVLFLDHAGYVTESTVWNFFMVKNGVVLTPETGILSGVTRQFVIECAHYERLPILETVLTRHDVWNADEAFLTNTSGEIVPIASLDGRRIGQQIPGAITKRLMARFQLELKKELERNED